MRSDLDISKEDTRDVAERAADISTLSTIDVFASNEALLSIIPDLLADGYIVKLGEFGTFSLRIHSVGSDDPKDVSARNITRAMITFRPGKGCRRVIDGIEYERFEE